MINSGRFGIVLFVVCTVTLAEASIILRDGNNQYTYSMQCKDVTDVDGSTCIYGSFRNPCGKLACANGIGQLCDQTGRPFRFGKCANGLMCACDRCQGCIGSKCFQDVICESRHLQAKRMKSSTGYASYPMEYSDSYNEY